MVNLVVRSRESPQLMVATSASGGASSFKKTSATPSSKRRHAAHHSKQQQHHALSSSPPYQIPSPIHIEHRQQSQHNDGDDDYYARPISPLTQTTAMFAGGSHGLHHPFKSDPPPSSSSARQYRHQRHPASPRHSPRSLQHQQQVQECDYDIQVTRLYDLLEQSDWEAIPPHVSLHPDEAHIWIVRKDHSNNSNTIRWRLLPLHAAVIFQAPLSIVQLLVRIYPEACQQPDDQGMMPLHLAGRHWQSVDLFVLLMQAHPPALYAVDHRHRTPLDHAKSSQGAASSSDKDVMNLSSCWTLMQAIVDATKQHTQQPQSPPKQYDPEDDLHIASLQRQVQQLHSHHAEELQDVHRLYQARIQELQTKHDDALQKLHHAHTQECDQQQGQYQEQIQNLQAQYQRQQGVWQEELHALAQQQTSLHQAIQQHEEREQVARTIRHQLLTTLLEKEIQNSTTLHEKDSSTTLLQSSKALHKHIQAVVHQVTEDPTNAWHVLPPTSQDEGVEVVPPQQQQATTKKKQPSTNAAAAADLISLSRRGRSNGGGGEYYRQESATDSDADQNDAGDDGISAITDNSNF